MIDTITILGGHSRTGAREAVERIDLKMGDVVSIVGPTGSGKTTLINDLELFADANTQTGRRVLINGRRPPVEYRDNPACNPIALITQHTTFLSDLPVLDFLTAHAGIRAVDEPTAHDTGSEARPEGGGPGSGESYTEPVTRRTISRNVEADWRNRANL